MNMWSFPTILSSLFIKIYIISEMFALLLLQARVEQGQVAGRSDPLVGRTAFLCVYKTLSVNGCCCHMLVNVRKKTSVYLTSLGRARSLGSSQTNLIVLGNTVCYNVHLAQFYMTEDSPVFFFFLNNISNCNIIAKKTQDITTHVFFSEET